MLLKLFHNALDELLRVGQILHDELNIHDRLAWPALALAVDAMLPNERHGIGDCVHGDGQATTGNPHHGLVMFKLFVLLVEYRHGSIVTARLRGA